MDSGLDLGGNETATEEGTDMTALRQLVTLLGKLQHTVEDLSAIYELHPELNDVLPGTDVYAGSLDEWSLELLSRLGHLDTLASEQEIARSPWAFACADDVGEMSDPAQPPPKEGVKAEAA